MERLTKPYNEVWEKSYADGEIPTDLQKEIKLAKLEDIEEDLGISLASRVIYIRRNSKDIAKARICVVDFENREFYAEYEWNEVIIGGWFSCDAENKTWAYTKEKLAGVENEQRN